jgi:hypothetical protein
VVVRWKWDEVSRRRRGFLGEAEVLGFRSSGPTPGAQTAGGHFCFNFFLEYCGDRVGWAHLHRDRRVVRTGTVGLCFIMAVTVDFIGIENGQNLTSSQRVYISIKKIELECTF